MRNVFPQLFDVRPRRRDGEVDIETIKRVEGILDLTRVFKRPPDTGVRVRVRAGSTDEPTADLPLTKEQVLADLEAVYRRDAKLQAILARTNLGPALTKPKEPRALPLSVVSTLRAQAVEPFSVAVEAIEPEVGPTEDPWLSAPASTSLPPEDRSVKNGVLAGAGVWLPNVEPRRRESAAPRTSVAGRNPAPKAYAPTIHPPAGADGLLVRWVKHPSAVATELAGLASARAGALWPSWRERRRELKGFVGAVMGLAAVLVGAALVGRLMAVESIIVTRSFQGFRSISEGVERLQTRDFLGARSVFGSARLKFVEAQSSLGLAGRLLLAAFQWYPFSSPVKEAKRALATGEALAAGGEHAAALGELLTSGRSLTVILGDASGSPSPLGEAKVHLDGAIANLERAERLRHQIVLANVPAEARGSFAELGVFLPPTLSGARALKSEFDFWSPLLGRDRPSRLLVLFQNPSELRPTGGFLGTYGILEFDRLRLRSLVVDGIFNPDGQLSVKVVPPKPVRRISTAWSMHDANWFFDYPTSAQKIAWFYEKTGEPSVDGVMAVTPAVLVRLLKITGPIEMPDYHETVTADNFVEVAQREVELEYDRTLNRPKQFLADLVPQLLARLEGLDGARLARVVESWSAGLEHKDILLYFVDEALEAEAVRRGWGGEVRSSAGDYLAVVHTNLNGFKSDYVTDDELRHEVQIEADGSLTATVTIRRTHRGGHAPYSFWNQVNTEWLRVYVPAGSELVSASGYTRGDVPDPIDYKLAGFREDADIKGLEQSTRVDPVSGTTISRESGKTVFGNWVFTSPGQSTVVQYRYRLPWQVHSVKPYTFLWQKQPGTAARFSHEVIVPQGWQLSGSGREEGVLAEDWFSSVSVTTP
ncbi:DUF4012 domain-containing protein [Candidatus Parcubacteria bacterium]|nr:DUF4012 domain-containing protein [Candidatus Parcubacteria bacterium]